MKLRTFWAIGGAPGPFPLDPLLQKNLLAIVDDTFGAVSALSLVRSYCSVG